MLELCRFTPTVVMREMQPVRAVAFSPDGWLFAAGSNNRALRVCRAPMEEDLVEATEGDRRYYTDDVAVNVSKYAVESTRAVRASGI